MYRMMIAGALALAVATPAAAQSKLLSDWAIADMRTAVVSAGAVVTGDGTDENGALYVTGKTTEDMKFLAYGTVCSGKPIRCKGANLSAGFTLSSDAEVDAREKKIDRMAIGARNGGENSLDVNRYIIFDGGITPYNLETNIRVFLSIADEVWNGEN